MTRDEMNKVLHETPIMTPVFKITKLPDWLANKGIEIGDLVFRGSAATFVHMRSKLAIDVEPSYLDFVDYWDLKEIYRKAIDSIYQNYLQLIDDGKLE